jgi:hypothetical protein
MTTDIIERSAKTVPISIEQVPAGSPMAMAILALQSGMAPEEIQKFMDLQDRYNSTQAKKAYDEAFAAFKDEGVKIIKAKEITAGPLQGRKYAELHDVVKAVTPALSKYGLSSSWKLTRDEPDWIEVTCYLRHVGGHQESVSMGGPPDAGGAKNAIQARASAKTYLERYTLKAILGLSEEADDTDGSVYRQQAMDEWTEKACAAQTAKDLIAIKKAGGDVFGKARDRDGYKAFMAVVAERMDEIQGDENA